MQEFLDLIRTNPWPFAAGLIVVVVAILAENFGSARRDSGGGGDFPDFGSWDSSDCGGD